MEKGRSIFLDVFRRADKNDDGALSLKEFKSFFDDGVMTGREIEDLFHQVDTHNTSNIDTDELCTYFSQKLGAFGEIFEAIEDMTTSVTKSLSETSKNYSKASMMDQFVTRFLMREIINQLSALQRPLEAASDQVDEEALSSRGKVSSIEISESKEMSTKDGQILPGRFGRRIRKQMSMPVGDFTHGPQSVTSPQFNSQLQRLQNLVDRLENRINFDGITEEQVNISEDKCNLMVHRTLTVEEDEVDNFRQSLRHYIEATNEDEYCLHLSIRTYRNSSVFVLYEIWDSETVWRKHVKSSISKTFQHANVETLSGPEQSNTMPIPASWWKREDAQTEK